MLPSSTSFTGRTRTSSSPSSSSRSHTASIMSATNKMSQGKLNFAAAKRNASSNQIGKAKTSTVSRTVERVAVEEPVVISDSDKYTDIDLEKGSSNSSSEDEGEDEEPTTATRDVPKPDTKKGVSPVVAHFTSSATKTKISEKAAEVQGKTPSSVKPAVFRQSNAKPEDVAKKAEANAAAHAESTEAELPELKPKDPKWRKHHSEVKAKMGNMPAIHGETQNQIHDILRVFDNTYKYGPCVGVSRLERWNRAKALGLNPPKEVEEILKTKQGSTLTEYSQSVFYGEV